MYFCSQDAACKAPFGAVRSGQEVTLTLRTPKYLGCEHPRLIFQKEGADPALLIMQKTGEEPEDSIFSITVTPGDAGLYFYYFDLYIHYQKIFRGVGGEGYLSVEKGSPWQLTVYEKDFATPENLRGGVIYQIFPDRFCEGVENKPMPFADRIYHADKMSAPYFWPTEQHGGYLNLDYYGGDFAGISQKLPYLAELGVTLIYLNPIFEAHANHRYNTANYMQADPLLGTNEEFAALCAKAKAHGIGIILDGVFSHTGSDSVYFNRECRYATCGAWQSEHSPYRSWYDFSPSYKSGYRCWWGFETLPETNEKDTLFRQFICGEGGVIDYWLGLGAAGFRLDVADELPDDFIEDIRKAVKSHGEDKYLLGEVWEDATNKWSYGERRTYLLGNGLDAVMNYPFKDAVLDFLRNGNAAATVESLMNVCENYPKPALDVLMNFVSTHDTVRAITALAGEESGVHDRYWQSGHWLTPEQYRTGRHMLILAYAMLFTLPGIPSIYYGDEICMQGYRDPFNRGYYDWTSKELRVKSALKNLTKLRKSCVAFKDGALRITEASEGLLCYERVSESASAAICINRSEHPRTAMLFGKETEVPAWGYRIVTQ